MMTLSTIFSLLASPFAARLDSAALRSFAIGGWRPLFDPVPLDSYYLLFLFPLVVAIAVVYKTIKLDDLSTLPRAALVLSIQIIAFMALAAIALWLITEMA